MRKGHIQLNNALVAGELGLGLSAYGFISEQTKAKGARLDWFVIPPLIARIRAEERLLRTEFGSEYDDYCARTWRLVPWVY